MRWRLLQWGLDPWRDQHGSRRCLRYDPDGFSGGSKAFQWQF